MTTETWFFFERAPLVLRADQVAHGFPRARPFPHAVLDGFLPRDVADRLAREFPGPEHPGFKRVDHEEQSGRLGHLQRRAFDGVAPFVRHVLSELNGQVFIDFLERVSGIAGLIPDPHFRGAGLHQALPGGHLALHADYNRDRFRGLERRLSVLLYLNPDWREEWGGELQLWNVELTACEARIAPVHNRLVVMLHRSDAWHGHPEPLRCPEGTTRSALAAYYYSVDRPAEEKREAHSAIWVKPS